MPETHDTVAPVEAAAATHSSRRRLLGVAGASALAFTGLRLPKATPAAAQLSAQMDETFRFGRQIQFVDRSKSEPYNSCYISVTGMRGAVQSVRLNLIGLSHQRTEELDILLVAPSGDAIMVFSDVGGNSNVQNMNITIADDSPALPATAPLRQGTYSPTNYDTTNDEMPPPAPLPNITTMAGFSGLKGEQLNGPWYLYTYDRSVGFTGTLRAWSLRIQTTNSRPKARDDRYRTAMNQILRVSRPGVLRNDSDIDGDKLRVIKYDRRSPLGRLTLRDNGTLIFRPKANVRGTARLRYTIADEAGLESTARIEIDIV